MKPTNRKNKPSDRASIPPARTLSYADAINHAASLLRDGKVQEAERLCIDILKARADDFNALLLLGILKSQQGNRNEALLYFDQALRQNPESYEGLYNRGATLLALNRHSDAIGSYDKALSVRSDCVESLNDRGNALQALKRHSEAIDSYDRALMLKPDYADALNNRGNALQALKRYGEAIDSYDKALILRPDHVEVLNHRGATLQALQRYEEALDSYDRALSLKPDYAEALSNRGVTLQALQRNSEALDSYSRALALKPEYVPTHHNLAGALQVLKRYDEAIASYDRAIALKPEEADDYNDRGVALQQLKRYDEALASYDKAIALKSDFADAFNNRGAPLEELKRYDEALASYDRAIALKPTHALAAGNAFDISGRICDWRDRSNRCTDLIHRCEAQQTVAPFVMLSVIDSPELQRKAAASWVRDTYPRPGTASSRIARSRHSRLRIGYASADFYEHATAYLMAELFERHDRDKFEIFAVSYGTSDASPMRKRLEDAFDRFIDVSSQSDQEIAHLMADLEIDISVDLKGFTQWSRPGIFVERHAPVQVSYLGYPGTTGATYVDYIIADPYIIPEESRQHYTEQVAYLPVSYQVNDSKRMIGERLPARKDVGLPDEGFVFCCFNHNYKITPEIFDVWMRLLHKVEGSVLWLFVDNHVAPKNLRLEAQKKGVSANRVIFANRVTLAQHLSRIRLADLFLDTLPVNAHTTASDALWAGVPVLTCSGRSFAARVAGSLLHAVGAPELVVQSMQDYEALALELAKDTGMLSGIKARMKANRATCPLFDTDRFRRHLESAYMMMWERYEQGLPASSFTVQPLAA